MTNMLDGFFALVTSVLHNLLPLVGAVLLAFVILIPVIIFELVASILAFRKGKDEKPKR